jgi:hypothetical protein
MKQIYSFIKRIVNAISNTFYSKRLYIHYNKDGEKEELLM